MRLADLGRLLVFWRRRGDAHPLELAGALIHDGDGRLLLLHRAAPGMTWWEVPGGKVERGEDLWSAAARELAEELTAQVEKVEEIATEDFNFDGTPMRYTWYVARVVNGNPKVAEQDRFDQLGYFTFNEIASMPDQSPSLRCLVELHGPRLRDMVDRLAPTPPAIAPGPPTTPAMRNLSRPVRQLLMRI